MHEQGIVDSLLSVALANAAKAKALKIRRINLVVGELTGVVDESMDLYFGFLSENTIASGAKIVYRHIPIELQCRQCDHVFKPQGIDYRCPACGEQRSDVIAGRELYIENMEVE
jgi:hydrogenase nickel incorporation protein HypA/HybF